MITSKNQKRTFFFKSCQMYVPGTLENTKSVLVNIGTGYFVEKVGKEMLPSTSHQHVY